MKQFRPSPRRAAHCRAILTCSVVALAMSAVSQSVCADDGASSVRDRDEILVISSRRLGSRCDEATIAEGLEYRRLAPAADAGGARSWQRLAVSEALSPTSTMPTVFYIHGNRVPHEMAVRHGLSVYRSMDSQLPEQSPVRFVIWSWPSEKIRGVVKDYRVKAARTNAVGWQVAWAINQLPPESPLAVVGYSYGARVATGALHLLSGGSLGGRSLPNLRRTAPAHAVLLAAALDADWLHPRGYHGKALDMVDRLSLVTNRRDPAMRFYHLTTERDVRALGYAGPAGLASIRRHFNVDVDAYDATDNVGRSHALFDYLRSSPQVARAWHDLSDLTPPALSPSPGGKDQLQMATRGAAQEPAAQGG